MIRRAKAYFRRFNSRFRQADQIYMVLAALVIGLVGGLAAVAFRLLIGGVSHLGWRNSAYTVEYLAGLPAWWKVLVPAVGGLVVGLITYRFAREARGHGVPEVMEAVALRGGRIRPRVVVAKLFASGISIGSGGSVGREGPIVQIGSALGSTLGQWLRVDHRRLKTLVGCGAAAGIAGTFNAPVAGALFAVEVILGDFGVSQFSPIVISSVAATVVSHRFLGDFPAFQVPLYSLEHPLELFAYAGLGILAALVAILFIRSLYASEDLFDRLALAQPLKPMIGGVLIGLVGIGVPHIFGVGYDAITQALNGAITWQLLVILVVFKIVAVSITIGSGGSGGVFAPSLFIGAMLGGAVGTLVHSVWPLATGGAGAYALVGMGAVVAAGTHAPITAILIIFELTGDYEIILPLMISCIIATLLATRMQPASIYTLKLLRRGTDIYRGRAVNVLQPVPVREVMQTDVVTVSPGDGLISLIAKFIHEPGGTIFVTESGERLEGIITADQITPIMQHAATLDPLLIAADIMVASGVPIVAPDDSLADVMKVLGAHRGGIPVAEAGRLVGVIWPEHVIERYNTEVFKRDMASSMVSAVTAESPLSTVPAVGDSVVAEVPVPAAFVGKTIRALNIRQRFGVSILMVKHRAERGRGGLNASPDPEYRFQRDDLLLVLGPQDGVRDLKRASAI
jgi:CIC family chloride channel protein